MHTRHVSVENLVKIPPIGKLNYSIHTSYLYLNFRGCRMQTKIGAYLLSMEQHGIKFVNSSLVLTLLPIHGGPIIHQSGPAFQCELPAWATLRPW